MVRIFHILGRKVQIWLKVTFSDRMKRNLGLKYFLQVNLGDFKNKATAIRGELNWGRPMQEIADLDRTLKESFCFFLFGKKR